MQWPLRDGSAFGNQIHVPYEGGRAGKHRSAIVGKILQQMNRSTLSSDGGVWIQYCVSFRFQPSRSSVFNKPILFVDHRNFREGAVKSLYRQFFLVSQQSLMAKYFLNWTLSGFMFWAGSHIKVFEGRKLLHF